MRYLSTVIFFFSFLFSVQSFAQYDILLHKAYAERLHIINTSFPKLNYFNVDSVDYFKEIDKIEKLAIKYNDNGLLYDVMGFRAYYYKEGKQRNPEAAEISYRAILNILNSYGEDKYLQTKCNIYVSLGLFYEDIRKQYAPAFYNYAKAYYIAKKLPSSQYPPKKAVLYYIARAYYHFSDYENATAIMKEADAVDTSLKNRTNGMFIYMDIKNTLGMLCIQKHKYDSALYYFHLVHELAVLDHNKTWVDMADDNTGFVYYCKGDYDKALALTDVGVPKIIKPTDTGNVFEYLIDIGDIYLKKNDPAKAAPYLKMARICVNNIHDTYSGFNKLYRRLSRYEFAIGDHAKAYAYADSCITAIDSMKNWETAMDLSATHHKVELEEYNASLLQIETKRKIQMLQRNSLVAIIILSAIIAILAINRRRLKSQQKAKLSETELLNATQQLNEFTRNIREKNELIAQLQNNTYVDEHKEGEDLLRSQQFTILNDDQWNSFRLLFEKVHKGFLSRLNEKLPNLSPAEVRYIALTKLRLSSKDIAAVLGISPYSVRNYTFRLRKKLNLQEDANLDDLIKNI